MTDVPPPDESPKPRPPRGRPRVQKPLVDEAVLSDEEVARRVDVRGGAAPRAPIERSTVRAPRAPVRRPERTGARDGLLLIGLVIVGLVAVRLFLPDGPLTATATSSPSGTQAAVVTTVPSIAETVVPTGGLITLAPTEFVPTASPAPVTEPPITAAPSPTPVPAPTPTLKPGDTPKPTPKPTKTPAPSVGPTPPGTAHVNVALSVINGDGGTAVASSWTVSVSSAGTANPSSFAGSASGTSVAITAGASYTVSVSGPSGYAKSASSNCASSSGGLPVANATETCTIVLNDIAPSITVYTIVDSTGDPSGTPPTASDITVTVTGTHVRPSTSFSGLQSGREVTVNAGTDYNITQGAAPTDYARSSDSAGCDGNLALGQTATCTVTYTYNGPPPTGPKLGLVLPFLALPWRPRRWRPTRRG